MPLLESVAPAGVLMLRRRPHPQLQPFVKTLWLIQPAPADRGGAGREHVLPTGDMHLVLRLTDDPLRLFRDRDDRQGSRAGLAVVGGARAGYYIRETDPRAVSVGAQLHPGASLALLGVSAHELAGRHTPLDELWGREVASARERLLEARDPASRLDCFERLLLARLPDGARAHPGMVLAAQRLARGLPVARVVEDSGYSHRRFIELFERETGLTPKRYARVQRFQQALHACAALPRPALAELALAAGYSDQAHFTREFAEFAGLTPEVYRALSPEFSHHVRLPGAEQVNFLQDGGGPAP